MDNLNYDAEVAARLAEAITAHPVETKNSVAKKILMPHSTFERRLAGDKGFTIGQVMRMAQILNVPTADLLPERVA